MTSTIVTAVRRLLTYLVLGTVCLPAATADKLPSRAEILTIMRKVNGWQLAHPVIASEDRNWERGTWYTGVMSAWKETRNGKFLDQALAWGRQHGWQVGTEPGGANKLFCAETWLELFFAKHDRAMIQPTIQWLNTNATNSPAGAKRWYLEAWGWNHVYADSFYGAPALPMLAKATQDQKYLEILQSFFEDLTGTLQTRKSDAFRQVSAASDCAEGAVGCC